MARLLYIESSPRKKRSSSIEVAKTFLDAYRQKHPNDEIVTFDLWHEELPPFDGDIIDAKYSIMSAQNPTEEQKKAWQGVENVINKFKNADKYVISLPMWNFSIPYKLKHFIDVIVQPTYTFTFSPTEGYKGLIKGKNAAIIYSRGGAYGPGTGAEGYDFQKPYLETMLKFIGFEDKNIQSIVIENTGSPEKKIESVKQGKEKALKIASDF